jgi:hypothetical protein
MPFFQVGVCGPMMANLSIKTPVASFWIVSNKSADIKFNCVAHAVDEL